MIKKILSIFAILLISIVFIFSTVNVQSEKTIRVFGCVKLDGNPLSMANITIKSMDRGHEVYGVTNSQGDYDLYINSIDHEDFKVFVDHADGYEHDEWFEVKGSQTVYELNFNFFSNGDGNGNGNGINGVTNTISTFFEDLWEWLKSVTFWQIVKYLILLILLILLIKLLIPNGKPNNDRDSMDNDVFIISSGRVKKF